MSLATELAPWGPFYTGPYQSLYVADSDGIRYQPRKRWLARFFPKSHVVYFHFRIYLIFPLNKIRNLPPFLIFKRTPDSLSVFRSSNCPLASLPFTAPFITLRISPLVNSVPIINGVLISKRMSPKGSLSCKTVKISPIIKLCFFSSFEKLFTVSDFWEVGNKSAASVNVVIDQVRSKGWGIIHAFLLRAGPMPCGYIR